MPGLLDMFGSDPQTQGLLSAAAGILQASGPSLMPRSFGQVLGAGLQGMQQGQQLAQQQALDALRLKGLQGELADKDQARKDALAAQDWIRRYNAGGQGDATAPARSVLGSDLAPTVANADRLAAAAPQQQSNTPDLFSQRISQAAAMRASGNPLLMAQADKLEEAALKFRPKYETKPQVVLGADGKPTLIQTADDGTVRSLPGGYGVAEKMDFRDAGGSLLGLDPYTGKPLTTIKKTQSPDSVAVDRRAAADRAAGGTEPSLNDATLDFLADQALRGDTTVYQNMGRGAQGAANLVALRTRVAQKAQAQGLSGADLASIGADYQGQKAGLRTSGNISARVENAIAEADQLAPLAVAAGRDVARSGFLPFGQAQIMFNTQTNDPALKKFATANNGLVSAYAGAMARGQKPTRDDYDHARHILAEAQSQAAYEATVQQMQLEMKAASAAPKMVRDHLRNEISGQSRDHGGATVHNPVAPPAPQKFDMLPPAAQFDGKRMRADNGTIYVSRSGKWIKE